MVALMNSNGAMFALWLFVCNKLLSKCGLPAWLWLYYLYIVWNVAGFGDRSSGRGRVAAFGRRVRELPRPFNAREERSRGAPCAFAEARGGAGGAAASLAGLFVGSRVARNFGFRFFRVFWLFGCRFLPKNRKNPKKMYCISSRIHYNFSHFFKILSFFFKIWLFLYKFWLFFQNFGYFFQNFGYFV